MPSAQARVSGGSQRRAPTRVAALAPLAELAAAAVARELRGRARLGRAHKPRELLGAHDAAHRRRRISQRVCPRALARTRRGDGAAAAAPPSPP